MKKIVALLNILVLACMASAASAQTSLPITGLTPGGLVQPQDLFYGERPSAPGQNFYITFGSAASQNVGTNGAALGLLNAANTYSAPQTFLSGDLNAADPVFTGGSITLPAGTTSARPSSPVNGMIRYNTSLAQYEAYASGAWSPLGSGSGSGITALTGDGTASGTGSVPFTLATVNSNVGTFGSASTVPQFTTDGKGRITGVASVTITPAAIGAPTTNGTGASGTWGIAITGNSATATALAALPSQCSGSQFATGITANGTANCATPAGSGNVSGPVSSTNLFIPQWSGTTGTSLLAGLPVGTSGNSTIVETDSGGHIVAAVVPTLNQNTTGTAANITGVAAIANGGTGQATQQAALNALAGATTSGLVLRGNGTNVVLAALQASDVPTLNQSTTGNAATSTALASAPTQCTGSQFATGIAASGNANCATPAGGGSGVTNVSVVTANGFSATVANPTTTPAITLSAYSPVSKRNPNGNDDWTKAYFGDGSIDGLVVTTNATGCSGTPTLSFAAPSSGGITATGHLLMNGGTIVAPVIDIPGRGYTSNPTVTVSSTTGCSVTPVLAAYYTPNGQLWVAPDSKVYQAHQTDAGYAVWSYFQTPDVLPLDSITNSVTAATPSAAGTGYNVADTITLPNGTVLAVATLTGGAGSGVATVTVTTAGAWPCYTSAVQAQVSSSAGGTGATFTVTLNTAEAAYGTRVLTQCYASNKAIDVVRASDSAIQTIGFIKGVLDLSMLQNFCNGTTCKVSKWYDQSGRGNDAVQTTDGNRPIIDIGQNIAGVPVLYGQPAFMSMPSGVAYAATNETVYALAKTETYGVGQYTLNAGLTVSNSTTFSFISNGFFSNTPSSFIGSLEPAIIGGTVGSSSATYSVNDFEMTGGFSTQSGNLTGGTIGNSSSAALATGAFFLWPRTFTAADRASFRASVYRTFKMVPQQRDVLIATGDSRTYGLGTTNQVNYELQAESLTSANMRVINTGVSGSRMSTILSRFYTGTGDAIACVSPHGPNSWAVLWDGTNDIGLDSTPAATIYANVATYISQMHALGCKVAIMTEQTPAGSILTAYNVLITANSAGADLVIPVASNPIWGANNWAAQSVITGVHTTTYGDGYIANDVAQSLNAVFH